MAAKDLVVGFAGLRRASVCAAGIKLRVKRLCFKSATLLLRGTLAHLKILGARTSRLEAGVSGVISCRDSKIQQ